MRNAWCQLSRSRWASLWLAQCIRRPSVKHELSVSLHDAAAQSSRLSRSCRPTIVVHMRMIQLHIMSLQVVGKKYSGTASLDESPTGGQRGQRGRGGRARWDTSEGQVEEFAGWRAMTIPAIRMQPSGLSDRREACDFGKRPRDHAGSAGKAHQRTSTMPSPAVN